MLLHCIIMTAVKGVDVIARDKKFFKLFIGGPRMGKKRKKFTVVVNINLISIFATECALGSVPTQSGSKFNVVNEADTKARHSAETVNMSNNEMSRFVVLYTDGSAESSKAEEVLRETGIFIDMEYGEPREGEVFPTAIYNAWQYRGLDKINILRQQIEFEAKQRLSGLN